MLGCIEKLEYIYRHHFICLKHEVKQQNMLDSNKIH